MSEDANEEEFVLPQPSAEEARGSREQRWLCLGSDSFPGCCIFKVGSQSRDQA